MTYRHLNISADHNLTQTTLRKIALLIVASLIISACASNGGSGSQSSFDASQTRQYAEELSQRGDHAGAARQYLNIANNSQGELRNRYLILAAREGYQSNDITSAESILAQVGQSVTNINLGLWAIVTAEVKLAAEQPRQALMALRRIPPNDPDADSARVLLLQAEALFQLGQAEAGVNTLIKRDATLRSAKDRSANQRLIYLGMQSAGENLPANPESEDPITDGWLVLGYITWQQRSDVSGLRDALADWRNAYSEHPAATMLVPELMTELGAMLNYPDRVAVLLPLSGRQKATAEVIRDGFLAAYFALSNQPERPEVMIYDTSGGATAAY
ncbi:MAG: penicillin-binding protein activator, partial [Gammaproteobacteria bacterium]|nr:penicillin-binding protein activator [Gammaproteobacteria bacterium]